MAYTEKMRQSHLKNPPTRRDYELIADTVASLGVTVRREDVARAFAGAMRGFPGFKRERFLKACGAVNDPSVYNPMLAIKRYGEKFGRKTGKK